MQPVRSTRPLSRGSSPNLRSTSPRQVVSFGGPAPKKSNSNSPRPAARSYSPRLASAFLPSSTANKSNVTTLVFPATARESYLHQRQQQQRLQDPAQRRTASPSARTASPFGGPLLRSSSSARPRSSPVKNNNNNNNNSRANSPVVDPRSQTIAPFRDITRQPTSTTIDGRLLYLLKDYSNTVLPSQDHKVQNIASRLRRSKILQKEEMTALETCFQRNANFMATVERILGEAVEKQTDMRRSVIHQAYEIWRVCADANTFIGMLLDTAQSAIGAGKYNKANISQYNAGLGSNAQMSGSVRSGSSRHVSPVAGAARRSLSTATTQQQQQQQQQGNNGGSRSGTPAVFAQIARPNAPSRQQLEPFHSNAANSFMQRTASPHGLRPVPQVSESLSHNAESQGMNDFSQNMTLPPQSYSGSSENARQALFMDPELIARQQQQQHYQQQQQRGGSRGRSSQQRQDGPPIGVEDAKEAQLMFEKLFGPEEGRTRFLHWLSELPQSTIQQLHRHLSTQQQ